MLVNFEEPLIAAVRHAQSFERALTSPVSTIFLLSSDLTTLRGKIVKAEDNGKKLFVHVEFCDGMSKDRSGLEFLMSLGVKGIISTKTNIIVAAKELGLECVQRFFIIDSQSLSTALDTVRYARPDLVEIMPGIMPDIIAKFARAIKVPVIAGGLIENKRQIMEALNAGASAISTGAEDLWLV